MPVFRNGRAALLVAMSLLGPGAAHADESAVDVTLESPKWQVRLTTEGEGEQLAIVGSFTYTGARETCRGTLKQMSGTKPDRITLGEKLREGRCQPNCNFVLVDRAMGYEEVCYSNMSMKKVDEGRFTKSSDTAALLAVVDRQAESRLAAIEKSKVPTGPLGPQELEAILNTNVKAPQTNKESESVARNPLSAATLCSSGNERACLVLQIYVRYTLMDTSRWSRDEKLAVAKVLRKRCSRTEEQSCYSANSLDFSVAKAEGFPDPNHPRWCLLDRATYQAMQTCYGRGNGYQNCVPAASELTGYQLVNSCKVPIQYRLTSSFDIEAHVLQPGETARLNTSERVEWVVRTR